MSEVYLVIDARDSDAALEQAERGLECGADGMYLIDRSKPKKTDRLVDVYNQTADKFTTSFVGLNISQIPEADKALLFVAAALKSGSRKTAALTRTPNGLWVDNAATGLQETVKIRKSEHKRLGKVSLMGGLATDDSELYEASPKRLRKRASNISPFVDVFVTTLHGRGKAADEAKIRYLTEALGKKPLAVSTISDNPQLIQYGKFADQILVAGSAIQKRGPKQFDWQKLRSQLRLIRAN